MSDTWGLLVEGPVVQTFSSEVAARNWQKNLQSFWGVKPAMLRMVDGKWIDPSRESESTDG